MTEKSYKIIFATDQHFNHPKLNPRRQMGRFSKLMIAAIIKYKPDAVVLGGDWFDRPTSFTSAAGVYILEAMSMLISTCERHGVALRVVKGTGSHDGTQNDNWVPMAQARPKLDFKLYDSIDVFSDLGFNVLTIPDSTISNHSKCEIEVRRKLAESNLKSVDLCFSHGMFTHHLQDAGFKVDAHDSEYYNGIIDIVGLNGHVHTPSLVGKILTGGSVDRLRQGENHAKGIHLVTIDKEKKSFEAMFIENEEAAIFNSYDITDEDPTIAVDRLRDRLNSLDADDIYVRLHYQDGVSIRPIEKKLAELYPRIVFDSVPNDKAMKAIRERRELTLAEEVPEGISPDTVIPLTADKFARSNMKFTPAHAKVLEEIKNAAA